MVSKRGMSIPFALEAGFENSSLNPEFILAPVSAMSAPMEVPRYLEELYLRLLGDSIDVSGLVDGDWVGGWLGSLGARQASVEKRRDREWGT